MVIDLLEREKAVNIKGLVLPEPNQRIFGLPFNPDRDITASDQEEIQKDLADLMNELFVLQPEQSLIPSTIDFFQYYLATKVVKPQITEGLPIDGVMWPIINRKLGLIHKDKIPSYFHFAALVKTTFPQQKVMELAISSDDQQTLKSYLDNWFFTGENNYFFRGMWDHEVLFPQGYPQFYLDNLGWSEIKRYLSSLYQKGDRRNFVQNAAYFRMAFPEFFQALQNDVKELQFSDEDWKDMRKNLIDKYKSSDKAGNWENFTVNAMNLTILAAEEVKITDKGLEITMPKPQAALTEPLHDLPQRRKF